MAVKGTQHTKKMMSVAARFAAKRENSIQELWSTVLCSNVRLCQKNDSMILREMSNYHPTILSNNQPNTRYTFNYLTRMGML